MEGSYGEQVSKELQSRLNLTNEATEQIRRDIDLAIATGIKLDNWLRLPPSERTKKRDTFVHPNHYNKRKGLEPYYTDITRKYTRATVPEVIELASLRKDVSEVMKFHYEGRILSNETKIKMNRIKELEFKFNNQ